MIPKIVFKSDIKLHAGVDNKPCPAINVKVHNWPSEDEIKKQFPKYINRDDIRWGLISSDVYESHCELFWNMAQILFDKCFAINGKSIGQVSSVGRSGGWLVASGLPELEYWDAVMFNKWKKFNTLIGKEFDYYTSIKAIVATIKIMKPF